MLQFKVFAFNPLQVNTYLVYDSGGAGVLIDAACQGPGEFDSLSRFISENDIRPALLVNTHGHFDHLFGAGMVKRVWQPEFLIHQEDARFLPLAALQAGSFGFDFPVDVPQPDRFLSDGEILTAGEITIRVIGVPGHSPGGVALYIESMGWLFTGDTLFAGGIGRTDLPGGDYDQILDSIRSHLLPLPGETKVFPGHGPSSTIHRESAGNPFLQ